MYAGHSYSGTTLPGKIGYNLFNPTIGGVVLSRKTGSGFSYVYSKKDVNKQHLMRKTVSGRGYQYATKLVKEG